MNANQYADLQLELLAGHPLTGVYSANDQTAADEINAKNIEIDATTTGYICSQVTDAGEFNALSASDQQLWVSFCTWPIVDFSGGMGLATAQGIWAGAAGAITRPALVALSKEMASRATVLNFGFVIIGDIQNGRAA